MNDNTAQPVAHKRVISVVGARPNFVKVAPIHKAFVKAGDDVEHIIVHTGQHYDEKMSDVFFRDLNMPKPVMLNVGSGSHAQQVAKIMVAFEECILEYNPDLVIVVGDVNSTIACALTAVKMGVKVAHVEAGLRSGDRSMPEEVNRVATDAICDIAFVTEPSGELHLVNEGWSEDRIHTVGNTMIDSQYDSLAAARDSSVLSDLKLQPAAYCLMTMHRPSNVDDEVQLRDMLSVIDWISEHVPVVFAAHPRTENNIQKFGLDWKPTENTTVIPAQDFVSFLSLMMNARFVVTDSGGIQEETTALGVPCYTLRTSTERPVTVDIGTNVMVNPVKADMITALQDPVNNRFKKGKVPPLWDGGAADRIVDILKREYLK